MKKVFKYILRRQIEMPKGAEILHVDNQREQFCLWALVDLEQETEKRNFAIVKTGNGFTMDALARFDYIGAALFDNGNLVFHAFEIIEG